MPLYRERYCAMNDATPEIRCIEPAGAALDDAGLEEAYRVPRLPWLRATFVASLDGAVELEGRSGKLGGPVDRAVFVAMRSLADVILVGAGTARVEGYGPVEVAPGAQLRRLERRQAPRARLAVVSASGNVAAHLRFFGGQDLPIVVTTEAGIAADPSLSARSEVVVCGEKAVDLGEALKALHEGGMSSVLCEGGPTLLRSLLDRDLLDELCLTISPVLAGSRSKRLLEGVAPAPFRFELASLLVGGQLLLARYRRSLS